MEDRLVVAHCDKTPIAVNRSIDVPAVHVEPSEDVRIASCDVR